MSKLREKLNDSIITNINIQESENRLYYEYNNLELSEKCEQIADDFAVKFAEWVVSLDESLYYTKPKTELLQIFKDKYYE